MEWDTDIDFIRKICRVLRISFFGADERLFGFMDGVQECRFGSCFPEVGSRMMMTRILTGQDIEDGWINVQKGVCV
jgi:hypothetical protein